MVVMNLMTWLLLVGVAIQLLAGLAPARRLDAAAFDRDRAVKWENARSQSKASASVKRQKPAAPRVFLLDAEQLQAVKERLGRNDQSLAPALAKLERDAQEALTAGPFSVVSKDVTPPSGDKRDYMSQAPYWWPDPARPDGLPYIRRDGERNPEINKITDHRVMDQMVAAVETLALAYYMKGDDAHAEKAARLLRAWFLEPATRMNPNLEYAQGIPGVNTGRGIGLIETRGLTRVVDAVGLLAGAKAWTETDQHGLQDWFDRFLRWMLESKHGREEAAAKNNHGTYYDLQVVSFALFLEKRELATNTLKTARQKRIAAQIEPDGRQPLELARTRAWSYSVGNLDGLMQLARLGENVRLDLWNYQTNDGRSIRRAFDFLLPFALTDKKWPYQQLGDWPPEMLFPLIRRAAAKIENPSYKSLLSKIPATGAEDRGNLLQATTSGQQPAREQWGAPAVTVTHASGRWTIAGKKNRATLNETDLSLDIQAGNTRWTMLPSMAGDMIVKCEGSAVPLRLAAAQKISVVPFETGFR